MKHISGLLNTSSISIHRGEDKNYTNLDPTAVDIVNKLFAFFYSICRGFDKQYEDTKRLNLEKTQWIKAFMDIGFNTLEKIQHGIRKCRLKSPINTPRISEFVEWCSPYPEELGYPDHRVAFNISVCMNAEFSNYKHNDDKIDKIIRHVIRQIGAFAYRRMPDIEAKKTFETYYTIAVRDSIKGTLDDIKKMLEDDSVTTEEKKKQDDIILPNYKGINKQSAFESMRNLLS